jgi:hypothetical protein
VKERVKRMLRQRKKTREAAELIEKNGMAKNERWIGMETDTIEESFVAP